MPLLVLKINEMMPVLAIGNVLITFFQKMFLSLFPGNVLCPFVFKGRFNMSFLEMQKGPFLQGTWSFPGHCFESRVVIGTERAI